jgi:cell division protein FtsQ
VNASVMPPERPAERPPMDPRLRARMIAVRRQAGRRRLKGGLIAAIVVAVLALAAVATRLPILSVGSVQVSGATYTDPALIAGVVRAIDGSSMLSVDLGSARRQLEASPWVKRVSITKDWPRGIRIDIAERTPVAGYLATDGQFRVIDDEGRVIAALAGQPTAYPAIVPTGRAYGGGPALAPGQQAPAAIADGGRLVRVLPDELRAKVVEVGVNEVGELELHLRPQGTVLLGSSDAMRDKLISVLAVLHDVDPASIGTLDVRAPAKPVCEPACKSLTPATP